jgi:hypothetical protein
MYTYVGKLGGKKQSKKKNFSKHCDSPIVLFCLQINIHLSDNPSQCPTLRSLGEQGWNLVELGGFFF